CNKVTYALVIVPKIWIYYFKIISANSSAGATQQLQQWEHFFTSSVKVLWQLDLVVALFLQLVDERLLLPPKQTPPEVDKQSCTSLFLDLLAQKGCTDERDDIINIVSLRNQWNIMGLPSGFWRGDNRTRLDCLVAAGSGVGLHWEFGAKTMEKKYSNCLPLSTLLVHQRFNKDKQKGFKDDHGASSSKLKIIMLLLILLAILLLILTLLI
nr:hypothetical protein [Tanacetum cinerariifolium]